MVAAINSRQEKIKSLRTRNTELGRELASLEEKRLLAVKNRQFDEEKRLREAKRRVGSELDRNRANIRGASIKVSKERQRGKKKREAQTEPKPPPEPTGISFSDEGAKRLAEASQRETSGVKSGQAFRSHSGQVYFGQSSRRRPRRDDSRRERTITGIDLTNPDNIAAIKQSTQNKEFSTVANLFGSAQSSRVQSQQQTSHASSAFAFRGGEIRATPRRTPQQAFVGGFLQASTRGFYRPKTQGRTALEQGFFSPATSLQTLRTGNVPFSDQVQLTAGIAGRGAAEYGGGFVAGRLGAKGLNYLGNRFGVKAYKVGTATAQIGGVVGGTLFTANTAQTIARGNPDQRTLAATRFISGGVGIARGFRSVPTGISVRSVAYAPTAASGRLIRGGTGLRGATFTRSGVTEGTAQINVFGKVQTQPAFVSENLIGTNIGGTQRFSIRGSQVASTSARVRGRSIPLTAEQDLRFNADPDFFLGTTSKGAVFGGQRIGRSGLLPETFGEKVDIAYYSPTVSRRGIAVGLSNQVPFNRVQVQPLANEYIALSGAKFTRTGGQIGFNQRTALKFQEVSPRTLFDAPKRPEFQLRAGFLSNRRASFQATRTPTQQRFFEAPKQTTFGKLQQPLTIGTSIAAPKPIGIRGRLFGIAPPIFEFSSGRKQRTFSGLSTGLRSSTTARSLLGTQNILTPTTITGGKISLLPTTKVSLKPTTRTSLRTTQLARSTPLTPSSFTPPPPPPPTGGFPLGLPPFPLFGSDDTKGTRRRGNRGFKYAPSLTAFFGGKKPRTTKKSKLLTGLEVRGF